MSEKKFEAKTFTLTGVTYKRTEKGYCTRDGKRIPAKAFEDAEEALRAGMIAEIDANVEDAKETAERAEAAERDLTPEETEELVGLRTEKLWSWFELAKRYGISESAARRTFDSAREIPEVEVEIPETESNTEEVYTEEQVPPRPEFEIEGVNKKQATVGYVNGHEYVHDWFGKRYFRDGEEITKFEYEHEVYGMNEKPKSTPKSTPKPKRRPKDVAFEHEGVTLTAKQHNFLVELSHLGEDELLGSVHSGCWCDILCDVIGGQFAGKPMTVGAMVSTLCEKGLGERSKEVRSSNSKHGRTVTVFRLTEAGEAMWEAMKL